ncbi:ABC transporter permease [Halpernia frigidisoli]|uniref:ABC-type transport system involved in multi-copper enzyme maturation, permease component n=1 Tax=Halpernia frigidisoli TaxID=1125876 RepID=A0A1I3D2I2_9FLAO|nr:ABC transporter permease subunit [Halpernia frigidisoli]SFH80915.1 ABC-type transport system involved in multi-copper enzyme maturation, permease component [Halpernia frigidisoli]
MNRLIKIEWLKNYNYKPFKIFTILYFSIVILLLFVGLIDFDLFGKNINLREEGIYNFPEIWNFTTYIVGLLKIFLGCIIIFSICQEFSNRMFKQNLIDGLSRKEFIISKLSTILIFSLASTVLVFLITLYLGKTYSENQDSEAVFKEIFFIGNYFLKLFTFFSFLMFLSILLRKSIFVFLGFFVLWFVEGIASGIEKFANVRGLNPKEVMKVMEEKTFFSDYLPLSSMSKLIEAPFNRLKLAKILGMEYQFHYPTGALIACVVWSIIFIAGSYLILKKRDW